MWWKKPYKRPFETKALRRKFQWEGTSVRRTLQISLNPFPLSSSSHSNNLGFNAGAGVMGYFNDHVGLRGDMRYLRTLTGDVVNNLDLGGFHFWRLSAGLVLR